MGASSDSTMTANVLATSNNTKCMDPLQNTRSLLRSLRKATRASLEAPSQQQQPLVATIKLDLSSSDHDQCEGGGSPHVNNDEQSYITREDEELLWRAAEMRSSKTASGASRPSTRRSPFVEYEARE